MAEQIHIDLIIPDDFAGLRLDAALAKIITDYSRGQIQAWIKSRVLLINGKEALAKHKVKGGEQVTIDCTIENKTSDTPQAISLHILYEDDSILILNKPAGLVVHPGSGHHDGTLVNALLHHHTPLSILPRAGLIHRIDKDTSGLLCVAKTSHSYQTLFSALQAREIKRQYSCVVVGTVVAGSTIDAPIGRHPHHRTKMAIVPNGKPAVTHYRIKEKFNHYTHLSVQLETGRTHQIRVHMTSIKHPLIGDKAYGSNQALQKGIDETLRSCILKFNRQALHAEELSFAHPKTGEQKTFHAPLPNDLTDLLENLRKYDEFI